MADNRDVMVVNLDSYREAGRGIPMTTASFLVFNSTSEQIGTTISLPMVGATSDGVVTVQTPSGEETVLPVRHGSGVPVNLSPQGWLKLRVQLATGAQ